MCVTRGGVGGVGGGRGEGAYLHPPEPPVVENQSVLKVAKVVKGVGLFYDVTLDFNILYLNLIFYI